MPTVLNDRQKDREQIEKKFLYDKFWKDCLARAIKSELAALLEVSPPNIHARINKQTALKAYEFMELCTTFDLNPQDYYISGS